MNPAELLSQAKKATPKAQIEEYRETVEVLREKGYSWRDIASFLNERGIDVDHTRIYRTFGKRPKSRQKEFREIQITQINFVGIRTTKKKNFWNIMELSIPSKFDQPITVMGYAWGKEGIDYVINKDDSLVYKNSSLLIKTGDSFPISYVKLEFKVNKNQWLEQEVYIMPKWETLI